MEKEYKVNSEGRVVSVEGKPVLGFDVTDYTLEGAVTEFQAAFALERVEELGIFAAFFNVGGRVLQDGTAVLPNTLGARRVLNYLIHVQPTILLDDLVLAGPLPEHRSFSSFASLPVEWLESGIESALGRVRYHSIQIAKESGLLFPHGPEVLAAQMGAHDDREAIAAWRDERRKFSQALVHYIQNLSPEKLELLCIEIGVEETSAIAFAFPQPSVLK